MLCSCAREEAKTINVFYDMDSLLTMQQKLLAERKPVLIKQATLSGKSDSLEVSDLNEEGWSKEFQIFRELDLNKKPVNKENYTIHMDIPDPYSNLFICEYEAKSDVPVRKVKIYYHDKLSNPRRIEGEFYEYNGLYTSTRTMVMELNNVRNKTLVTRYSVAGGQKMILDDTVEFQINAFLIH
jgi:hypothetical protein